MFLPDDPAAREAVLSRRADRARQLHEAADVVLLGHDDDETITVTYDPDVFRPLPGVQRPLVDAWGAGDPTMWVAR